MRDVDQPLTPQALTDGLWGQLLSFEDIRVHAHDEDLLVVRAVEDANVPALGQALDIPPQKVMAEVLRRRLLEGEHLAALRIDARHHMLDRTILACRVHRLKYEQQRPAILSVKHVLFFCEPLCATGQELGCLGLLQLEVTGVAGVEVLEAKAIAGGDAERVNVFLNAIEDVLSRHASPPFRGCLVWPDSLLTALKILSVERSRPGQQRGGR